MNEWMNEWMNERVNEVLSVLMLYECDELLLEVWVKVKKDGKIDQ